MPEETTERVYIEAPPERVYEVAVDVERYPEWAKGVKAVTVLSRDAEDRPREVEFRAAAMGKSITYCLHYDYEEAPSAFSWSLVKGDLLRRLDGTYRFDPEDGGTRVTYQLSVDLALPLPGIMKRRAEGMIIGAALRELKRVVESGR